MLVGIRTLGKDKGAQGLRISGEKRTLGTDKVAWEGQGHEGEIRRMVTGGQGWWEE